MAGAGHLATLYPPVLREARDQQAVVQIQGRVTGDPRASRSDVPAVPDWSVPMRVTHVTLRGRTHRVRAPVLVCGPQAESLAFGSAVVVTGRVGRPPPRGAHAATVRVLGPVRVVGPPGAVVGATNRVRAEFTASVARLPQDAGALVLGLAVGDESLVSPELERAMIRSGLAHLTAVSGSNTALVGAVTLAVVSSLGFGWRVRSVACAVALVAYTLLVRPQPSVLRAVGMGAVALLGMTTGGRRRGTAALLATCLGLLLVRPALALSLGLALSAAATAGLLVAGPPLAERLGRWPGTRRVPRPVRDALAVATAAHVATLPLAIGIGNGASLVALPANVLATPAVPVATVLGLVGALVAPVSPGAASILAQLAAPFTAFIAAVAHRSADLPLAVLPVPGGPGPALASAALVAVIALVARAPSVVLGRPGSPRRRTLAAAVAVFAGIGAAVPWVRDAGWPPQEWVVLACPVGQGDAVLLRAAGSSDVVLVDVGPDPAAVRGCLAQADIQRIGAIVLSHFHADHVDGLAGILGRWPVGALVATPVAEPPDSVGSVAGQAATAGVPAVVLPVGRTIVVGGASLTSLWPARRIEQSSANNGSLVVVAEVPVAGGTLRVLLPGDVEPPAQAVLMAGPTPAVDVVKVPHHGSALQDPRFAEWTGARIALVTVGADNAHGHPSADTLAQYRSHGAAVGRTDVDRGLAVVVGESGPELVTQR